MMPNREDYRTKENSFSETKSCNDCAGIVIEENRKPIEKETSIDPNIETPAVLVSEDEASQLIDENDNSTEAFRVHDDIPLIDDYPSLEVEDGPRKTIITRPKYLQGNIAGGLYHNPLCVDSPDIFSLRAPLVSCENILTPGISAETLRPKQI